MKALSAAQGKMLRLIYEQEGVTPPAKRSTLQALSDRGLIVFEIVEGTGTVRKTAKGRKLAEELGKGEKSMGAKRRPSPKGKAHYDSSTDSPYTACGLRDGEMPASDFIVMDWSGVTCSHCRAVIRDITSICKIDHGSPRKTLCDAGNADRASNHNYVTCTACHALMPPEQLIHFIRQPSPGTPHTSVCDTKKGRMENDWEMVTCHACRAWRDSQPPVPSFVEGLAYSIIWDSIVANHEAGLTILQGGCPLYCNVKSAPEGACICCSLLRYRLIDASPQLDLEQSFADILGVPHQWAVDLLSGADGDKTHDTIHHAAFNIGKTLWSQYVKLRR